MRKITTWSVIIVTETETKNQAPPDSDGENENPEWDTLAKHTAPPHNLGKGDSALHLKNARQGGFTLLGIEVAGKYDTLYLSRAELEAIREMIA